MGSGTVPDRDHRATVITDIRSPNFGPRRDKARPDIVVLHYTAMETAEAAVARLCDTEAEVSAHYVISETGCLWQLVSEEERAWHAGAGAWGAVSDVNSRSIGIELANRGAHPFPEPQMAALEDLLGGILERWSIPAQRVIGHSDMAIGRKFDPGARFDWRRLARQGLAVWPDQGNGSGDFFENAQRVGYCWQDGQEEALIEAFRMRFNPGAQGALCDRDRALMADLAARWPVRTVQTGA